ncbi:hypothetical protein ACFFQF_09565 [Haladaptatus pallidirubidus]|uniref:Small CPxCG-related zinc finger protein n=1 Tax=Haladaptatus pallidirubidus TaxID=1008152 RepID=A0AAV3UFF1_9EURY|nr:hypothetical protein [Haladaptatus pallidirubidus]
MATEKCDGCGADVPIAGGIANLWNTSQQSSGGMTLEFEDGSEHFLCFACIEQLPDYPSSEDVAKIETAD